MNTFYLDSLTALCDSVVSFFQVINYAFFSMTFFIFYYNILYPARLIKMYENLEEKLKVSFKNITQFGMDSVTNKIINPTSNVETNPLSIKSYGWLLTNSDDEEDKIENDSVPVNHMDSMISKSEKINTDKTANELVINTESSTENNIAFSNEESSPQNNIQKIKTESSPENNIQISNRATAINNELLKLQLLKNSELFNRKLGMRPISKADKNKMKCLLEITNKLMTIQTDSNKINRTESQTGQKSSVQETKV